MRPAPDAAGPGVLVTGFSVFPGAPVNPTEALAARLGAHPPAIAGMGIFRAELLPVEYAGLAGRLERIAADFVPDIAIHFGLAHECRGFRLERLARNGNAPGLTDNAGRQPESPFIMEGGGDLPSGLPLARLAARLGASGMPFSWSDDAGGYLCNYLFYLSRSGICGGFRPAMSGFIHVPPSREAAPDHPGAMSLAELEAGARLIVGTCVQAWLERHVR